MNYSKRKNFQSSYFNPYSSLLFWKCALFLHHFFLEIMLSAVSFSPFLPFECFLFPLFIRFLSLFCFEPLSRLLWPLVRLVKETECSFCKIAGEFGVEKTRNLLLYQSFVFVIRFEERWGSIGHAPFWKERKGWRWRGHHSVLCLWGNKKDECREVIQIEHHFFRNFYILWSILSFFLVALFHLRFSTFSISYIHPFSFFFFFFTE